MCCLVMGDNLVMLYLGWEGVGFASYWLIGYYYERPVHEFPLMRYSVEDVVARGQGMTRDLGGAATTEQAAEAVAQAVSDQ